MSEDTLVEDLSEELYEEYYRKKTLAYQRAIGGLTLEQVGKEPADWVEYNYINSELSSTNG